MQIFSVFAPITAFFYPVGYKKFYFSIALYFVLDKKSLVRAKILILNMLILIE